MKLLRYLVIPLLILGILTPLVSHATLGEYLGAGSGTTKLLLHLNGNSTDSSGNANNGTDTAVTYGLGYGRFGQGAYGNGTNSYINITDSSSLRPTSSFTFSAFVSATNNGDLFASYSQNTNVAGIDINLNGGDGSAGVNKLGIVIGKNTGATGGTDYHSYYGSTTLNDGVLRHIAITWDGTNIKMYVNGNSETVTKRYAGTVFNPAYSVNNYIRLFCVSFNGTNVGFLSGYMDEVIVENRAWSASEIKKYYTYAKGRFGIQ